MALFSSKAADIILRAGHTLKGFPSSVMLSAAVQRLLRNRTVPGLIADNVLRSEGVSVWEALLAAAQSLGDKRIDSRDLAAIQSALGVDSDAEKLVVSRAQSAARINAGASTSSEGITLWDVLADGEDCMPGRKKVTEEVAKRVARAEKRNSPDGAIHPAGIAACMAAAAKLDGY